MVYSVQGKLINSPLFVIQLILYFNPYMLLVYVLRAVVNDYLTLNRIGWGAVAVPRDSQASCHAPTLFP